MSSKIKIMFMNNNLYGGGAEKILQTILNNLDQNIYDITLYGVKNEILDHTLYPKNITYRSVFNGSHKGGKLFLKALVPLANKVKLYVYNNLSPKLFYKWFIKGTYDVEVAFIEGYSTKIIGGSPNPSTKIAWVHIDLEANHWTNICYKDLQDEIAAYKNFNHIVSVSKSVQDAFSRKFNLTDNLVVKYNPLDQEDIKTKSKLNESVNINANKNLTLISVGRLEPQKGYDRLIKVTSKLRDEGLVYNLKIIGEGNKRNELEQLITTNNLSGSVELLGFQSNPYQFIKAADIFVCSSRSEGFSTVVTEALILEKPIVATNCAGMHELLGDSEFGLLTENSEDALYKGIKEILTNNDTLQHYKQQSIVRGQDFDIKKTMKEVEKLWL